RHELHRPRPRADLCRLGERLVHRARRRARADDGAADADALLYHREHPLLLAREGAAPGGRQGRGSAIMIRRLLALGGAAGLFALPGPAIAAAPADAPVVDAPAGRIAGAREGAIEVFRGIPYALPPVGARRWRPPAPMPRWEGTRAAREFGPACI